MKIIHLQKDIDRFWSKVNKAKSYECWEWIGIRSNRNYGRFKLNGKQTSAHRFAWEISRRHKIPDGMLICHHCDNSLCCNPMHLYCGTQFDNMKDRDERNPVSANAFGHGKAKLSAKEIEDIRKMKGKFSSRVLGRTFKVNQMTICNVWNSNKWLCKEGYYA